MERFSLKRPHLAIAGTRGVPANYGGFETFAQELGARFVDRGWDVTVYCRSTSYAEENWVEHFRGMRRRRVRSPRTKYLETVTSSLIAVLDASLVLRPDALLLVNGINAWCSWIPRLVGIPTYLNVDGIERQRDKWNAVGRAAYRVSERLSTLFPTRFVSDAEMIRRYYLERFGSDSPVIPYGADPIPRSDAKALGEYGLEPGAYLLYVSRLEPENGALDVIEAYAAQSTITCPLVVVGDAPYATAYKRRLQEAAARDPRVRLLGALYGDAYRTLQGGACLYIQATSVGGTHPALLEAMAAGNAILARDTPEHREVLSDAGEYFTDKATLSKRLVDLVESPEALESLRVAASRRVAARYSWEAVVDQYAELFHAT